MLLVTIYCDRLPTLFISECVLIYLEVENSDAIIKWAASNFHAAAFVTYEQIRPHDSFGAIMIKNLQVLLILK